MHIMAKHYSKCFICIISFSLQNKIMNRFPVLEVRKLRH